MAQNIVVYLLKWWRRRRYRYQIFAPPKHFRSNRKLSVFVNEREIPRIFEIKLSLSDSLSPEKHSFLRTYAFPF